MATLTPEVQAVLSAYRTAALTTLRDDGTPVATPVTPLFLADQGVVMLALSIGAFGPLDDMRRHERVSLLWSDPTGSGLDVRTAVAIRGRAQVDNAISTVTDLEAFWHMLNERQPGLARIRRNSVGRWLYDWLFMRLIVSITPEEVLVWPEGDLTQAPQQQQLEKVK